MADGAGLWRAVCGIVVLWGCEPNSFSYEPGSVVPPEECRFDSCASPQCPPGTTGPDENGECVPTCAQTWRSSFGGITPYAMLIDGSDLRVVGNLEADGRPPAAWIGNVERCVGAPDTEQLLPTGSESSLRGASLLGEALLVVGSSISPPEPSRAFVSELDREALTPTWTSWLPPSTSGETLLASDAGSDAVWAVGATSLESAPRALAAKILGDGTLCSFGIGAAPGALAAVRVVGNDVYAAGFQGSAAALYRIDAAGCSATSCGCQPAQELTGLLPAGVDSAEARALVVDGSVAYLGGSAVSGTTELGFVMDVDLGSGAVVHTFLFDATPAADALLALTSDGTQLYAGGFRGRGPGGAGQGQGVLLALALPLSASSAPVWSVVAAETDAITALQLDTEATGVLAGGHGSAEASVLLQCTSSGMCPTLESSKTQ